MCRKFLSSSLILSFWLSGTLANPLVASAVRFLGVFFQKFKTCQERLKKKKWETGSALAENMFWCELTPCVKRITDSIEVETRSGDDIVHLG